jgi:hypothetical protein
MSQPRSQRDNSLLVIVPCGFKKIWDRYPDAGPTAAEDAYVGPPFKVNRKFAERAGGDWVVLSAKYGFLRPTDLVPGSYNPTLTSASSYSTPTTARTSSRSWAPISWASTPGTTTWCGSPATRIPPARRSPA